MKSKRHQLARNLILYLILFIHVRSYKQDILTFLKRNYCAQPSQRKRLPHYWSHKSWQVLPLQPSEKQTHDRANWSHRQTKYHPQALPSLRRIFGKLCLDVREYGFFDAGPQRNWSWWLNFVGGSSWVWIKSRWDIGIGCFILFRQLLSKTEQNQIYANFHWRRIAFC